MTIETTALTIGIACALPLWLLAEELLHRRRQSVRPAPAAVVSRDSGARGTRAKRIVATVTALVVALLHVTADRA